MQKSDSSYQKTFKMVNGPSYNFYLKIFWGQNFDFQLGAQNRNVVCAESKIVLKTL